MGEIQCVNKCGRDAVPYGILCEKCGEWEERNNGHMFIDPFSIQSEFNNTTIRLLKELQNDGEINEFELDTLKKISTVLTKHAKSKEKFKV